MYRDVERIQRFVQRVVAMPLTLSDQPKYTREYSLYGAVPLAPFFPIRRFDPA